MKKRHLITSILAAALAVSCIPAVSLTSAAASSETVAGDVNGDGVFSVADVVLTQKWLLSSPDAVIADWHTGDMNSNGVFDVFDLIMMKRKLVSVTSAPDVESTGCSISFTGSTVAIADNNGNAVPEHTAVTVNGQTVTITQPGEYTVSGSSENGQLIVDVDKTTYPDGKVTLNLTGLDLSNPGAAPLYVASAGDECVVSVKKDTVNRLSDGTSHTDSYTDSDGDTKEINAVVFSRDDLKIKGKGTLIVNGNYADGIVCTDDLKIYNGTVQVTAVDDGIRGKDSVIIGNADDTDYNDLSLDIKALNGDGIKSTNTSDENKGYIEINGGAINIDSHSDGIQTARNAVINGGDITIHTYEGSDYVGANSGSSSTGGGGFDPGGNFRPGQGGGFNPGQGGGFTPGGGFGDEGHDLGLDFSSKGIKSGNSDAEIGGNITINGGYLSIDSTDDAIHCGDTLTVSGGNITVTTADDALHCDDHIYINGGTVNVTKSYEGIEAMQIYVTDGDITVYAEDDPVNSGEKGAQKTVDVANDNCIIQIDGGVIHAYVTNVREGDGVDSNGKIVINGGEVYVEGSVSGPDSALDSDGEMIVNGGTVMAVGGLGRGELPENYSQQCSLYWGNSSTTYQSGSVVKLLDADGNELIEYTTEQTLQCVVVSTPDIKIGSTYTLTIDGKSVAEFTVSSALTKQGDVGSGGGQGGGFNPGQGGFGN